MTNTANRARIPLVVLLLLASACGGSHHARSKRAPVPSSGRGSDVTAPGGAGVPIGGRAAPGSNAPVTTPSASPPNAAPNAAPAVAARQALDVWLAALVAADSAGMLAHSMSAAAALSALRVIGERVVTGRGGRETHQLAKEALTMGDVSTNAVTFMGEIDVADTVTDKSGKSATATAPLTGPIRVVNQSGWRVANFTYRGMPMAYYPEGVKATVGTVELRVALVLEYSGGTIALVLFRATKPNESVAIQSLTLTTANGGKLSGRSLFPAGTSTGTFDFPRSTERPVHLDVTAYKRVGTSKVTTPVSFSLDLPGQPS